MLSEHEFTEAIREIYPKAKKLENKVLGLFNQKFCPGRGITGMTGINEYDFTINYLESTIAMLKKIKGGTKWK